MQGGAADDLDARLAYFVQKQSNDGCFVLDKDSFFDEKLINEDGLQKWEERSTKGWKHSEYRKVTRTILDEPLEEFSNKIGGHKTLREFFAAVSLGDEKLDDEKMELLSLGMIYMESNGDPECKASGTKAWGLMQVTPIAAKEIDLPHDDSLFEPEHGIRAGLRYLARSTYLASGRKNYDIARGVAGYISYQVAIKRDLMHTNLQQGGQYAPVNSYSREQIV